MDRLWEFWIDVGGTFTDCIARSPENALITAKVLSSGITKGRIEGLPARDHLIDSARQSDPDNFWAGYQLKLLDRDGQQLDTVRVARSESATGALHLERELPQLANVEMNYELAAGEEAPVLAVRTVLGLGLDQPIPEIVMRLGTTRGTNALLTRTGARTAFVTTDGFRDVLLIGNQSRPRLFELAIQKPTPLFEQSLEINARMDTEGRVLLAPDEAAVRRQLAELKRSGIESIAICLLHSFANPEHEQLVARIAGEVGFDEISVSGALTPLIKIVSRGDTTVADAYLNPILRQYVQTLRHDLGKSRLRIMTSAGGLVDAGRFVGKDSVLSGPAGGVVGFSRVAERAGFTKAIGFDMGGTSTDVARFDGSYELEFETQKAGVRIVAPMFAIETVAAGGGSLCGFDGVKLFVGPQSAGAAPGPACYGNGGPLAITDINLFLGKILPSRFPFPLDRDVVEARLTELCDEIADSSTGGRFTPVELAEGFLKIANANMTRAIRKISVAKGYDPADYVLVTFGGAGAQHACAIARSLDIRQILVHPYAGILSAYGLGLADIRRFAERAVLRTYSSQQIDDLEPTFRELEQQAHEQVLQEGIPPQQIEPAVRSLELRYQGVDAAIHVVRPDDGDYVARYFDLHRQLYGYVHEGRAVEILAARVEVVGRMPDPPVHTVETVRRFPQPSEVTQTWFDSECRSTGVFLRQDLHPGDEIVGPAIICEPTSTVVIDPDFAATITPRGEVLITDTGRPSREKISTAADPVMLEIFNNLFASIAEQMGVTLERTSFSTNVKERLDFSCAIFSPDGNLVVNAPHLPVHLGAMSETVKCIVADNPDMATGDVYVTNDPYRGGSHLPDVTVVTPVHDRKSGRLLFFTASRAHHSEIGGIVPGSMPPFSKNLAEEGVLIRNFKLVDAGTSRDADLRDLLQAGPYPSRSVDQNLADVSAQVAANHVGVVQLNDLVERYSLEVVEAYMKHIQDAAASKMRLALARLPDREYKWTDHLDDGSPISVTITVSGESACVDFTGTGDVLSSNLNANRAIVTAAVLYVFRCLIDEDIPLNGGVLEPVDIVVPECLLNPPAQDDPAKTPAVAGGNVETSQRVVDVLLGALGLAAASQGTMNNLTFGDATFGYYETICGGSGATPHADGADAVHTHMTNTRLTDAEVIERRYPVRVREFSIRADSGGQGTHRGGNGIIRKLEFLKPLQVSILSERRGPYAPYGLNGGTAAQLGRNTLQRAKDGETIELGGKVALQVEPGDVLTIETPGGGGFGAP